MSKYTYKLTSYINCYIKKEMLAEVNFPQRKFIYVISLIMLLLTTHAQAGQFYQRVEQDVLTYAQQHQWHDFNYDISIWLPNKSSSLPYCKTKVSFKSASNKAPLARVSYLIRCKKPVWQIRGHAKIKFWLNIWHAKTDIAINQLLTPQLLLLKKTEISKLVRGFETEPEQLLNQYSQRRIRAGQVISPQQLQHPFLIKRGDEVIIRASSGTFVVTMKGKALQNGKLNDRIMIQNLSSKKHIQAKIVGDGIVETLF